MDLFEILNNPTADWLREKPARETAIQRLIENTGLHFPEEYLNFLGYSDGGEGELAVQPLWFHIFAAEEAIYKNKSYQLDEYLPGYFAFGNNMGLEIFVFNIQESPPWKVYYVPNIGMEEEAVLECAPNFLAFIKAMGHPSELEGN
ncbi:MAG: SMI1/KNR4 family protein [Chloroflexia bacterium]